MCFDAPQGQRIERRDEHAIDQIVLLDQRGHLRFEAVAAQRHVLDLDVDQQALPHGFKDFLQQRHALALEFCRLPRARIRPGGFRPASDRSTRPWPSVVRSIVGVVHDDDVAVAREIDVEFDRVGFLLGGQLERGQRVLRRIRRRAAMRDHQWLRARLQKEIHERRASLRTSR